MGPHATPARTAPPLLAGERFLLQTESRGMVHARLCVVVKDFARNHVHFGTQETVLES